LTRFKQTKQFNQTGALQKSKGLVVEQGLGPSPGQAIAQCSTLGVRQLFGIMIANKLFIPQIFHSFTHVV